MTAELGVLFLISALLLSLLQAVYLLPISSLRAVLEKISSAASFLQTTAIAAALAILILLRLESDFTVANVAEHSNLSLPVLYKIVGAWGNHEGSLLLWVFVLALFGALLGTGDKIKLYAGAVQSLLCAGFLAFILFTSNPFARIFPPPEDGRALNPLLQDVGLALHPPLLYFGYVGFSIVFSLAVASLIVGRAGRELAGLMHPWIMVSWSGLTAGIGLGSWWAYRELGWGGWWFWDPVENASLLPWLAGTALLHSNIVLKKRGILGQWVILLAIVTFALSLLGTFLVRSGAVTSVHSFASDPKRGVFVLAYIFVSVGGALLLYALRGSEVGSRKSEVGTPISREGMIIINNLFILSACATVLLGTLYPIFAEISGGEKITVGAPFFNVTFVPLMAMPLIFAGFAPFMAWKKASFSRAISTALPALLASAALMFLVAAFAASKAVAAVCGFGLAFWLFFASVNYLFRAKGVRGGYALFFGHVGAAFAVSALTASGLWNKEVQKQMSPGDFVVIADYRVTYKENTEMKGENYSANRAYLTAEYGSGKEIELFPEYRTYDIVGSKTSETAIYYGLSGDLYAAIGETSPNGELAVRLYYRPMISFLWAGFLLAAFGGVLAVRKNKTTNKITVNREKNVAL